MKSKDNVYFLMKVMINVDQIQGISKVILEIFIF